MKPACPRCGDPGYEVLGRRLCGNAGCPNTAELPGLCEACGGDSMYLDNGLCRACASLPGTVVRVPRAAAAFDDAGHPSPAPLSKTERDLTVPDGAQSATASTREERPR